MGVTGPKPVGLMARLHRHFTPTTPTACWLWKGYRFRGGYGGIKVRQAPGDIRNGLVHRVMWEACLGPIPAGQQVNHHCDVRHCVNPAHLYLGTQSQNICGTGGARTSPALGPARGAPSRAPSSPPPTCRRFGRGPLAGSRRARSPADFPVTPQHVGRSCGVSPGNAPSEDDRAPGAPPRPGRHPRDARAHLPARPRPRLSVRRAALGGPVALSRGLNALGAPPPLSHPPPAPPPRHGLPRLPAGAGCQAA